MTIKSMLAPVLVLGLGSASLGYAQPSMQKGPPIAHANVGCPSGEMEICFPVNDAEPEPTEFCVCVPRR